MPTSTVLLHPSLRRYRIAGLAVLIAAAVAHALHTWIGHDIPLAVLVPSILVGAWYGGFGAGLVSTALNALAAAYCLLPPIHSFRIADRSDWVNLAVLASQGVLISWLCESRRRTVAARSRAVVDAQQARAEAIASSHSLRQVNADLEHLLRSIEANSNNLNAFSGSLAVYSRLAATPPGKARLDTLRLTGAALEHFADQLREARAEATCEVPLPTIEADEFQFQLLLHNLIDNALKFRGAEALRVRISAERRKDRYIFSFADNGIGIVPAHWEEVFALGRRLHPDAYPGAGMGLAIAKRIVENHGGQIWLNSETGQGTTIRFSIPGPAA